MGDGDGGGEISSLLLYCDEDPFLDSTSTASPSPPGTAAAAGPHGGHQLPGVDGDDDEVAYLVAQYKAKEKIYAPVRSASYRVDLLRRRAAAADDVDDDDHRRGGVSAARSKAVHYIIYAVGRLGLAAATAFNAVNYLDRFLSINCHLRWEAWMAEVVSVACLSVACKLDEVSVPSLHDLQMEEAMSHSFRSSTIRDMELTLLKALQWRLACVTPYSYLDLLLPAAAAAAAPASRCTRLLLRSLSEPSFLQFDASEVAAAALGCSSSLQDRARLIRPPLCCSSHPPEDDQCFKMMKELDVSLGDHHHPHDKFSELSQCPVTRFETDTTTSTVSSRSALRRSLFGIIGGPATPAAGVAQDEDNNKAHIQ